MDSRQVCQHCQLGPESNGYREHAMEEMNFFARAHDRILKVARRLADLAGSLNIRPKHPEGYPIPLAGSEAV